MAKKEGGWGLLQDDEISEIKKQGEKK